MRILDVFLSFGLVFGSLAGLMAYLISFKEYSHHYRARKKPRKMALGSAALAFLIFFALAAATGLLFTNYW